jgi:hypothetical protein
VQIHMYVPATLLCIYNYVKNKYVRTRTRIAVNFHRSSLHESHEYDARQPAHHACPMCRGEEKGHDSCDCHQRHSCDHQGAVSEKYFGNGIGGKFVPNSHNLTNRLDRRTAV